MSRSSRPGSPDPLTGVTIDQLAQLSGMTVRNIRAHQARGLLPAPEVRGRTGFYGQDHVDRIALILELQAEGLNLSAIRRVLATTSAGTAGEALRVRRAILEPWAEETPIIVTGDELSGRFGRDGAALTERATRRGLLLPLGEDRYEVPTPSVLATAEELVALGLPLESLLRVEERLTDITDSIARLFVELIVAEVWEPFERRGRPEDEWPHLVEVIERVRPLAIRIAIASLRRSLGQEVERTMSVATARPRSRGRRRRG